MTLYRFCDLVVESDEALPLATVAGETISDLIVDVRLCCSSDLDLRSSSVEPIHEWRDSAGELSLSVTRRGSSFQLVHPSIAVVEISADGKHLRYAPHPDASREQVLKALLNQSLPRVMALQGKLVIHASAVIRNRDLLIFSGDSGAGKSTLARSLASMGLELVADDCVLLAETENGTWVGVPSYPGISAETSGGSPMALDRAQIGAIYRLQGASEEQCAEARVRPLSAREAMMLLTEGMFVLDPSSREQLRVLFDRAGRIASRLEVFELSFPWSEAQIPGLVDAVLEHAENRAPCLSARKGAVR